MKAFSASADEDFLVSMFPEKKLFYSIRETTSTTEMAVHTNPFTVLNAAPLMFVP